MNENTTGRKRKIKMCVIWINGEEATWKRVKNEYGESYAKELREEVKNCEPYTTIIGADGSLEVNVY